MYQVRLYKQRGRDFKQYEILEIDDREYDQRVDEVYSNFGDVDISFNQFLVTLITSEDEVYGFVLLESVNDKNTEFKTVAENYYRADEGILEVLTGGN